MSQAAARIRPSQDLAADRPAADPKSTASLPRSRWNAAATFQIAVATAIYTILSIVFFGRPELRDMRSTIIGGTADPAVYLWSIAWWPYAISRGINPFISHVVWTPYGENLVWRTAIPGVSLLSWPLTAATNPIVTYNLWCLISPPLAAVATFLLCRYITKRFWPSLLGGYVFGFSAYILGHMRGHLPLLLIFPAPLMVYLAIRKIDRSLSTRAYVAGVSTLLVMEYLFTNELLAHFCLLAAGAFVAAWFIAPQMRPDLAALASASLAALIIAIIALAPFVYYTFARDYQHGFFNSPRVFSADLLNYLVPTTSVWWGRFSAVFAVSHRFHPGDTESTAYIGPVALAVEILFARRFWRETIGKLILISLTITVIASLGPVLHFAGIGILPMPWHIVLLLPMLSAGLPVRITAFVFLQLSLIVAIYLAKSGISRTRALAIAALLVISMAPNFAALPHQRDDTPRFFTTGDYRRFIRPGENVLVLPFVGNLMLWQAETNMYFNMSDGYLGCIPPGPYGSNRMLEAWVLGKCVPDCEEHLRDYLKETGTSTVLAVAGLEHPWQQEALPRVAQSIERVDDVTLYRIGPSPVTH